MTAHHASPRIRSPVDEAQTASTGLPAATANAPRHDWPTETGGAIGPGLPTALGAAIAAPDRQVQCLPADGSSLYTHQALWTMAREQAKVTTILINNDAYAILRLELRRVGAGSAGAAGPAARRMLDLSNPSINHTAIAPGFRGRCRAGHHGGRARGHASPRL